VQPGEVIGLEPGERPHLVLRNLHGTRQRPIIITNQGGKVRIGSENVAAAILVDNCSHFKLTGDGDPGLVYGIEVFRARGQGVQIDNFSTDYEVCHLEIYGAGFAGIMAKTDPQSNGRAVRGTFTQYSTHLHHNHVHDVGGEAFYVGNSFWASGVPVVIAGVSGLFPADLVGVYVHDNIVERTGFDGIQVGCALEDCHIYRNVVRDTGLRNVLHQRSGIQIGEGTSGTCHGNLIVNASTNGIVMLGRGNNLVYNNVIVNPGTNGIYCDDRPGAIPGGYIRIYHNTIINPAHYGFLTANSAGPNEFINNIVVGPHLDPDGGEGRAARAEDGARLLAIHNIWRSDVTELRFADPARFDFRLTAGSPAINAGTNLAGRNVDEDRAGQHRSADKANDVGAYEYQAPPM